MANRVASRMLNEIFQLLDREGVLGMLGRERTQQLCLRMLEIARQHDCDIGDVLDEIQDMLGICWGCLKPETDLQKGFCPQLSRVAALELYVN